MDSPHPISVGGKQHKRRPGLSSVGRGEEPGVLLSDRGACPHPGGGGGLRRPAPGCPQTSFLPSWPRHLHLSGNTLLLFPSSVSTLHLLSFPRSCGQLEGGSGGWAGSPLQRTLSFLLGMTGKTKVGVGGEAGGLAPPALPASLPPHPPSALLPSFPGRQTGKGSGLCSRGHLLALPDSLPVSQAVSFPPLSPCFPLSSQLQLRQLEEGKAEAPEAKGQCSPPSQRPPVATEVGRKDLNRCM